MRPLDTKSIPRDRDVIDLVDSGSEGANRSERLSAVLDAKPDPESSVVFGVDAEGTVFSLNASGRSQRIDLPSGTQGLQMSAKADGTSVFLLAKAEATASYSIWERKDGGWQLVHDVGQSSTRPAIGGSADGVWLTNGDQLALIVNGTVARSEKLDFVPIAVSEGAEGTVWLLGGSKRYGGLEVRRYDEAANAWFLLPPPAAAISLAASPDGTAWGVSSKGELWRFSRDGAGTFRECGNDADCRNCFYKPDMSFVRSVSMGSDGNIWLLSGGADGRGFVVERMIDLATRETHKPAADVRAVSIAVALA